MAETAPEDRYCPVHGRRNQDGYNADLRCNAIVGYEARIPLLCAKPTEAAPPEPKPGMTKWERFLFIRVTVTMFVIVPVTFLGVALTAFGVVDPPERLVEVAVGLLVCLALVDAVLDDLDDLDRRLDERDE